MTDPSINQPPDLMDELRKSVAHLFRPETTNGGNVFADCSCGWSGGVHPSRAVAREAWQAHKDDGPRVEPIKPEVLFGARAQGMNR